MVEFGVMRSWHNRMGNTKKKKKSSQPKKKEDRTEDYPDETGVYTFCTSNSATLFSIWFDLVHCVQFCPWPSRLLPERARARHPGSFLFFFPFTAVSQSHTLCGMRACWVCPWVCTSTASKVTCCVVAFVLDFLLDMFPGFVVVASVFFFFFYGTLRLAFSCPLFPSFFSLLLFPYWALYLFSQRLIIVFFFFHMLLLSHHIV